MMSTVLAEAKGHESHGIPEITVTVFAPSQTDPKQFTWPQTMKVGDAAAEAAVAFGIDVESPTFQKGEVVLDRQRPLVGAHVKNHDTLELVSAGGGV